MENLIEKKRQIVNDHTAKLIEANQKILETLSSTLRDKKVDARIKLHVTKLLNLSAGGGGASTTGLESPDKLELAKGYLNNANSIMETVRNESGYDGLLKDIAEQLSVYRKEIEMIDQELKDVEDKERRKELMDQRRETGQMSD
jgi:hypothetical protein